MKKILVVLLSVAVAMTFAVGCGSQAKKDMKSAVSTANKVLETNAKPFDPATKADLKKAVESSEKADDDESYTAATEKVKAATKAYKDSVKQLKQVTNPKEAFLIARAKTVKSVTKVEAATEETDENKLMNKEGGYTSYIAMKSSMIKDSYYADQSPLEAGNDGGAVIEAFKTAKDAQARADYLAQFDSSGALASGTHKVIGTLLIRTSNELTASQQKVLEKQIINALIKLD